jgi:hypothetical protein
MGLSSRAPGPNFYIPHVIFQAFGVLLNILAIILGTRGSYLECGMGKIMDEVLWDFETAL